MKSPDLLAIPLEDEWALLSAKEVRDSGQACEPVSLLCVQGQVCITKCTIGFMPADLGAKDKDKRGG